MMMLNKSCTSVFAGDLSTLNSNSYSMHYCDGSWRDNSLIHKIKSDIKKYSFAIRNRINTLLNGRICFVYLQ